MTDRRWLPPLLAVLPFLPLLGAPLLIDERVLAFEAQKWIGLDPLAPFQVPAGGSGTWRPLTVYVYWLDASAPAVVRHAANLLIHAATAALVHLWLSQRLPRSAALLGACVFAVHPAHVATAGWVAGRADGLMVLAAVAALVLAEKRVVAAGLLGLIAVLFKETGAVIGPIALAVAWWEGRSLRGPLAVCVGAGIGLAGSLAMSVPGAGYLLSEGGLATATRWVPPYLMEAAVPTFVPIGVPTVPRDLVGMVIGAPILAVFVQLGISDVRWRTGVLVGVLALLPVAHVLPNDGGQWYLLLPSVGFALAWGALSMDRPRGVIGLVVLLGLLSAWESAAWSTASTRVEATLEAALPVGPEAAPPKQDPRDWPHRGPSFCCGLPWQLFEAPPE